MLFILFLIVHLAVSLLVYLGIESRKLKVHRYMFFVVLCLPIWGLLIVLVLHFQIWFEADDSIDVGVEKLKIESELYKSLTIEEKNGQNIIDRIPRDRILTESDAPYNNKANISKTLINLAMSEEEINYNFNNLIAKIRKSN